MCAVNFVIWLPAQTRMELNGKEQTYPLANKTPDCGTW